MDIPRRLLLPTQPIYHAQLRRPRITLHLEVLETMVQSGTVVMIGQNAGVTERHQRQ